MIVGIVLGGGSIYGLSKLCAFKKIRPNVESGEKVTSKDAQAVDTADKSPVKDKEENPRVAVERRICKLKVDLGLQKKLVMKIMQKQLIATGLCSFKV